MANLYVLEPGAKLQSENSQLVASVYGQEMVRLPIEQVENVIAHGGCHLTPAAIRICMREGITIALIGGNGDLLGRIEPSSGGHAEIQGVQWRFASDAAVSFGLARQLVAAKVRNQATVLRRRLGDGHDREVWQNYVDSIDKADNLDSLRGYEGAASAGYYRTLAQSIDAGWAFERRTMHPARDPVSACLNFVYTLLRTRVMGAIAATGLNPYLGVLHAVRDGHAALASDLMEEWRPAVADRLVLEAIDSEALQRNEFETQSDGAVRLGRSNLQRLITLWEQRLESSITLPALKQALPLRVALFQQALHVARHMRDPVREPYQAWRVR